MTEFIESESESDFSTEEIEKVREELLGKRPEEIAKLLLAERKKVEVLSEQTIRDPLTGLYNRRHLDSIVIFYDGQLDREREIPMACLFIDCDKLKFINDKLGHDFGDQALIILGTALQQGARASDVVARYGGDEVVILMPYGDQEAVEKLGDRISANFSAAIDDLPEDHPLKNSGLNYTVGSAIHTPGEKYSKLIKAADQALLEKKRLRETGTNDV